MGCKHAIPIMVTQGGGVIVNIASINGIAGLTGADAYTAAKSGVAALTRASPWIGPRGASGLIASAPARSTRR